MNKDKVIKDLRERNDKLQSQYYMSESRCYYAEHKLDEVRKLKIAKDKAYSELEDKYITLKSRTDKAIEYIKSPNISIDIRKADGSLDYVSTEELLEILQGDDNNDGK